MGRDLSEGVALTRELIAQIDTLLVGYDWRRAYSDRKSRRDKSAYAFVVKHTVNYLRDPRTPGNVVPEGERDGDSEIWHRHTVGWQANSLGRGRSARLRVISRMLGPRCSSTKRCAFGWPSSTPRSGPRAESRSRRTSSGCWGAHRREH